MNFFFAAVGRIMAPTNQPTTHTVSALNDQHLQHFHDAKKMLNAQFLSTFIYLCVCIVDCRCDASLSLVSIFSFVVHSRIRCVCAHLPFVQIKIIFMTLTIRFRIYRKIVKSIGMAILWMVTALRAILGDGSCSVLSSLFSSLDI